MSYYADVLKSVVDSLKEFNVTQQDIDDFADGEMFDFMQDYDIWDKFGTYHYENFFEYVQEEAYNNVTMSKSEVLELLKYIANKLTYDKFMENVDYYGKEIEFDAMSFDELYRLANTDASVRRELGLLFSEDLIDGHHIFFDPLVYNDQFLEDVYRRLD